MCIQTLFTTLHCAILSQESIQHLRKKWVLLVNQQQDLQMVNIMIIHLQYHSKVIFIKRRSKHNLGGGWGATTELNNV